jgi:hypothetical protein
MDCEIDPKLKPSQILFDNQAGFAKTKLDVSNFLEFIVCLDNDVNILGQEQRFLSEEKLALDEFERLGLVKKCHSSTVIQRDLTKASVYLALVRGKKNSSLRVVQNLRRINSRRKKIKRHLPSILSSFSRSSRTRCLAVYRPTWYTGIGCSILNPAHTHRFI